MHRDLFCLYSVHHYHHHQSRSPMATMAEISAAINQIDVKKQNLHKSFLHLQSQSPSSFNLPFNWSDVDSYFTTLQSSLQSKFNLLQTLHPPSDPTTVPARPELKSFCKNSDGLGLIRFIALASNQLSILSELPDAYRFSPDAPAMVLDAMVVFYSTDRNCTELGLFRSGCLIMLEGLLHANPDITIELKDKAMDMAVQWNRNRVSGPDEQEALGFVLLVGAYGLIDRFSIDDIIDWFLIIATDDKAIDLCRRIIPENNIKDMIQILIYKDMHVAAVKFIIQLQKTDEFSIVGLLEERKLRSMRNLEKKRKNTKYLDVWKGVTVIELSVLKSIIQCIDENHLESEYLKNSVVELVNKLENELENSKNVTGLRKQPARATALKRQLLSKSKMSKKSNITKKSEKQKINEIQPTVEYSPVQNVVSIQESHSQKLDISPDHVKDSVGVQNIVSVQESHSQKLDLSPDHVKDSGVEITNEVENNKQTSVNDRGLRKQPVRTTVLKSKMLNKSKKPKLNTVQPTAECALATPVQNVNLIQESRSQKPDSSSDHVECHDIPLGSGPAGSNSPSAKDGIVELVNKTKNEVENIKQTPVSNLGLRKQPARASVLKSQLLSKSKISKMSKKPKVNKIQPTVDSAAATSVQSVKSAQESHSLKSDLSPDHGGSAVRSGPSGSNAQNASLIAGPNGSTGADIGYNFFVQQSKPSADSNSNGWIWE